jgi:hypothetical protein
LTLLFFQIVAPALLIATLWPDAKAGFYPIKRPGGGGITSGNTNTYAFFSGPVSASAHPVITSSAASGSGAGGYAGFLGPIARGSTGGQGVAKGVVGTGGHGVSSVDFDVSKII